MRIARKARDQLEDIKDKIRQSYNYFKDNVKRYEDFVNIVFNTSLSQDAIDKLAVLGKPALEFNILEAHISRLRGEFMRQQPSIDVRAADGVPIQKLTPAFLETRRIVEAHLRETLNDNYNDELASKVYTDLLAGGFSVVEVYTEYLNDFSFDLKICVDRVFDPCLTGFDPLARRSDKSDSQYCFKLIPMTKDEFEDEFGKDKTEKMKFHKGGLGAELGEFNWSYKSQDVPIVMVAEFYLKVTKRVKLLLLTNNRVMRADDYDEFLLHWNEKGVFEQPPQIMDERWTTTQKIELFRLCGQEILSHEETIFDDLPLVFYDGNSIFLRKSDKDASEQMTRPYVYHAKGAQELRNFAGQTICAEIENMVQHKFVVAAESIPKEYIDAYQDVQQASVLVFNSIYKDNPEAPLPAPREIQRTPTPPIVEQTFAASDRVVQSILGNYDGILGINGNQISGVAIQQGALQSNAAAMPYLMGYINGLNRVAQVILGLIPKIYKTPRSIPIRGIDGKRSYVIINSKEVPEGQQEVDMRFDPKDLQLRVTPGPNAAVQKQVALEQITRMMQASPVFAEFINVKGLETIIDNMDIRGVDSMKAQALEFMQEQAKKQAEQAQAQQAMMEKGDPMVEVAKMDIQMKAQAKEAELELKKQQLMMDTQTEIAKLALEKQDMDMKFIEITAEIQMERERQQVQLLKAKIDNEHQSYKTALDALKVMQPKPNPMQ